MLKLKAEGVQKGFFDLLVFLPGKLLCIELKRIKGGVVSTEQKGWNATINKKYPYAKAYVCAGAEVAIEVINDHR